MLNSWRQILSWEVTPSTPDLTDPQSYIGWLVQYKMGDAMSPLFGIVTSLRFTGEICTGVVAENGWYSNPDSARTGQGFLAVGWTQASPVHFEKEVTPMEYVGVPEE